MASTDSRPIPIKNTAYRLYFPIWKSDGTLITTWTGMDSQVSKDGAAFAACTNEATEIGTTGVGYLDLTAAEMNADAVVLKTTVTNTSAMPVVISMYPEETGDINVDVTAFGGTAGTFASGRPDVNTTHLAGTAQTGRDIGASVLLSNGTGTGQISLASGKVDIVTAGINAIADQVWDEAASGHVAAGSFGQALQPVASGTATAGAATSITLAVGSSATTDFYKNDLIRITAGTGAGQSRYITAYNGGTRVASVATWATNPSTDSVYVILSGDAIPGATAPTAAEVADAVWEEIVADHDQVGGSAAEYMKGLVLRSGTLQAGSTVTDIILDAGASATNDQYNRAGLVVWDTGNLNNIQSSQISDYVGATKTATVDPPFAIAPSTTAYRFAIVPLGVDAATTTAIATGVWGATRAGNATAGSFGEYVNADATRISGSATPADQLEAILTGSNTITANVTGNLTGNVTGSVGSVTGSVGSVTGSVGSVTGAVGSVTGGVTVTTNNDKTGYALSTAGIDALFTRQLTQSYAADGTAPTVAQALMLIQQSIGDFSISGTTLTVKQLDGTTTAATYTLNDANNPTSRTRAT
jgi:hypothetical protein